MKSPFYCDIILVRNKFIILGMRKLMRCSKRILCAVLVFVMLFLMSLTALAKGEAEYEYYIENGTAVLTEYKGTSKKVVVPDVVDGYAVTRLEGTFCNNQKIKEVEISERISYVGEKTFYGCSNLRCVKLPLSLSHLGEYAFAYSGIKDIVLGPEIHYINSGCFLGCSELVMVESQALMYGAAEYGCFVSGDAFNDTDVKIFFSDNGFYFYSVTAHEAAFYQRFSIGYYIYQSVVLRPSILILSTGSDMGFVMAALYIIFLLAAIVTAVIIVARCLMTLFGRNRVAFYKTYSDVAFREIEAETDVANIIHYPRIEFKRDKVYRAIKTILWIIGIFIFLGVYAYIDFTIGIIEDRALLKSFVVFFVMLAVTFIIAVVLYKLKCFIKEHSKNGDKVRIRIRRINTGGKNR